MRNVLVLVMVLVVAGVFAMAQHAYVGPEKCKMCHKVEYTSWSATKHAKAWDSLKPADQANAKCNGCHSTNLPTLTGVSCEACHGGNLIDNHVNPHGAGWSRAHCTQCHEGQNGVSCKVCHGGDLLANHPNPHGPDWQNRHCTQCHDGQVNGVSCEACHGGDLIGNHPNPHTVGYRNSHCYSCHPGAGAAECEVCHEGGSSVLVHEDFWPPVHNRFGDKANCYDCH